MVTKMKVLLISPLPPPEGGIATWTKLYSEYCIENNVDFDIVNIALTGKRAKKINDNRSVFDEINRTINIIKDLKRKIKSFKPEIVHLNTSCSKFGLLRDYLCAKIIKKNKIPLVLHCRCNIEDQLNNKAISVKCFNKISKLADKILTLNTPSYNYASEIADGKVMVFPNFIKENQYPKIEVVNEIFSKVIFVGHVQRTKGIFEIIECAKVNSNVEFHVYGPITNEIDVNNVPSNVKMFGRIEHDIILQKLNEYDLFLFPTYTEGFSNALAEAMYAGLPVIATDVGANKDMVEDKGGIIVPVKDVDSILTAINVMKDYKFRQDCSVFNKNKVKGCYTIDRVMNALFEIYQGVMK